MASPRYTDRVAEAEEVADDPTLSPELVLAMLAAWRWQVGDDFPDRARWGRQLLRTLRAGPSWPTIAALTEGFDGPATPDGASSPTR